jgi:hypothetical protein
LGLARVFVLVEITDHHIGAFARERERHRASDARIGAGDERFLVL